MSTSRQPPPLITSSFALDVIRRFLPQFFETLLDGFAKFWDELLAGLTTLDLLRALDASVRLLTRLPYTSLMAFVDTVASVLEAKAGHYSRYVVRGDVALMMITKTLRESFLNYSLLGNESVLDLILERIAGFIWRVLTRSTIISRVLRLGSIRSLADLVRVFKGSALRVVWQQVVRVLLIMFAISFSFQSMLWVGLNYHKFFLQLALPQDSARVKSARRKPFLHRINARPGPDK